MKKIIKIMYCFAFYFCWVLCLSSCFNKQKSDSNILYRKITNVLNYSSVDEFKDSLYSKFDKIEQNDKNGILSLNMINYLAKSEYSNLQFLSDVVDEQIEKKVKIDFDCETISFVSTIEYYSNDNLIKEEKVDSNPYFSNEKQDYFIFINDEEISLSDTLVKSNIDSCIAIVDDVAYLTAIAVVAVVIVSMPIVERVVTGFTKVVSEWFSSFINWLKGKITRTVTYQPKYENVTNYEVRYNNYTYTLEETDICTKEITDKKYYLCFISTDEMKLYMSPIPLADKLVAPVLATSKYVASISKGNTSYCLSTYTKSANDAYSAALAAAKLIGMNYVTFHSKYTSIGELKEGLQFDHYHPGYDNGRCSHAHSLYGLPTLKIGKSIIYS